MKFALVQQIIKIATEQKGSNFKKNIKFIEVEAIKNSRKFKKPVNFRLF